MVNMQQKQESIIANSVSGSGLNMISTAAFRNSFHSIVNKNPIVTPEPRNQPKYDDNMDNVPLNTYNVIPIKM